MKLICKACNLEISEPLSELKDLNLINKKDGQDYGTDPQSIDK
ncbi:hypothetical protein [Solibacillus cecembensis]